MTILSNPLVPAPQCSYQGAYQSLDAITLQHGHVPAAPAASAHSISVGHAVDLSRLDGVPVMTLRSAQCVLPVSEVPPPSAVLTLWYQQNRIPGAMTFTVSSDAKGGLIGSHLALEVDSNYPDIAMSIARLQVNKPGLEIQACGHLPADYVAQIKLHFWADNLAAIALDAWLSVQIGYVEAAASAYAPARVVTTQELLYYPALLSPHAPLLGNNYPAPYRHRRM